MSCPVVVCGDFNIHNVVRLWPDRRCSRCAFGQLLQSFVRLHPARRRANPRRWPYAGLTYLQIRRRHLTSRRLFMPSSCRMWNIVMPFLLDHQDTLLTSCSVYWTLQRVSSLVLVTSSSTTACHMACCMRNCTGSTSHYKLGVTVHCCLQHKARKYLVDCCTPTPVSDIPSRRHLRSATAVNGPPTWIRLKQFS